MFASVIKLLFLSIRSKTYEGQLASLVGKSGFGLGLVQSLLLAS